MTVVRIVKDNNFITMGKYHLKEKDMSLKAKGLLSQMLSLPDNWDYSIKGLETINKEGWETIRTILLELEKFGYLHRAKVRDEKGKIIDVEYTIYEKPQVENPLLENPIYENPILDNSTQLNNKELNTNIINKLNNNKKEIIKEKRFKKPTLEEIQEYCKERGNNIDPQRFYDYYETDNWKDVKNWKKKLITWEMHQPKTKEQKERDKQKEFEDMCKRLAYLDEE